MASLRAQASGRVFFVRGRMLVGRSPSAELCLQEPLASGEHATIFWTGNGWWVRDLSSKNGTWVDGRRLETGGTASLAVGTVLGFAREDGFEVLEVSPPALAAVAEEGGELRASREGVLVLPDEGHPEVSVFGDALRGYQAEEADGRTRAIAHGEAVVAGGRRWRIELPVLLDETPMAEGGPSLDNVRLDFRVSRDEERVELRAHHRGQELLLPHHDHLYVLLVLARLRQADQHLPGPERGWVERGQLQKMLSMESNTLNVAIYRARRQLAAAGIAGAPGIVEVRQGLRRLGTERFTISTLP